MPREKNYESRTCAKRLFKPDHSLPGEPYQDYILLPYGIFYKKTNVFLEAKSGDTLRFFNGPDVKIVTVALIEDVKMCDILCRMRYGSNWAAAFNVWLKYARMEGNGKDVLCPDKCIMVVYENEQ